MLSVALAFFMLVPPAGSQPTVQNPGFESTPFLTGWEVKTRLRQEPGRAPTLSADRNDVKEGAQSLLIEALDPADAYTRQRVFLAVGSLWRARASCCASSPSRLP